MTNHPTQAGHTAPIDAAMDIWREAFLVYGQSATVDPIPERPNTYTLNGDAGDSAAAAVIARHIAALPADLSAHVAQIEAIAAKLAEYAAHNWQCAVHSCHPANRKCECGLTQALTEYKDATDAR